MSRQNSEALLFVFAHELIQLSDDFGCRLVPGNLLEFTVAALTTTGFGDITLPGTLGRLISIIIMIFGVTLFFGLARAVLVADKVRFQCPKCALLRHDPDAVHCKACGEELNIPTSVTYMTPRKFDVPVNILDCSRLKGETGWMPKVAMVDGMRRVFDYLRRLGRDLVSDRPGGPHEQTVA